MIFTQSDIPIGEWSHLAVTYDEERAIIFLNAKPMSTMSLKRTLRKYSEFVWIGNNPVDTQASRTWDGSIRDVGIFNWALNEKEILMEFTEKHPLKVAEKTPIKTNEAKSLTAKKRGKQVNKKNKTKDD